MDADARGRPYLVFRDEGARQRIVELAGRSRLTVGRTEAADLALCWDGEVSRVHAILEQIAGGWTLVDDDLSRNGSYVNHERVRRRRKLNHGDTLRFGNTLVAFRDPCDQQVQETERSAQPAEAPPVSEAQRRILAALCRHYTTGSAFPYPASNQEIADELVVSLDTVKSQLRILFGLFALEDAPRGEKRVRLVEKVLSSGVL